jgi:uncharacterized repeat protein (TIGR01451 family)
MAALPFCRRLPSRLTALAAAICALAAGCASLPRIDPTGERCCIWPKDQPAAAPVLAGNLVAPPVGTDAVFPAPAAAPVVPPGAVVAPTAVAAVVQPPGDRFSISPERILAPVNSDVVLKAAICTTEGYTLADQKVEWMLGRNGVGEFVDVGGKGLLHPPLISLFRGQKVDNYLARGFTANGPLCIDRGTVDPSDDVNINRGDAWASITSANEGTTYVTAYTPAVDSWPDRRGTATIYWVDVQWVFPPAAVTSSGRGEALTTTVTRQTNGSPIEGWIVRYVVNDGGGTLSGAGSGQVVEMRTGADGRATVQVSPTAAGAASSQIDVQLIRPAGFGGGDAPQLVIGSSSTVIQWGGSSPYLPPSTASPLPSSPVRPLPGPATTSPFPTSPGPATPMPQLPPGATIPTTPTPTTPTGPGASIPTIPQQQAKLEVEIRGSDRAEVGSQITFEVTIRNVGNAPATDVVMNDRFQAGLSHVADRQGTRSIEKRLGTIAPGESRVERLTFNVDAAGQLAHDVIVRFTGGSAEPVRARVNAVQAAPQRTAAMRVNKDGPLVGYVGQPVTFTVAVRNTGELPLVNIELVDEYPATLQVRPEPNVQVVSGRITRRIDRLEVGQSRSFQVTAVCLQPTREAYTLASATAQSDPRGVSSIQTADEHKLEILPPRTAAAPSGPELGTAAGAAANTLSVQTMFFNRPARAGARATCQITVANLSETPDEQVQLRVIFPPELTPDSQAVQPPPNVRPEVVGNELRFTPIAMLRQGEKAAFLIPMNATQPGVVEVVAQAISRNAPLPGVSKTETLEIIR